MGAALYFGQAYLDPWLTHINLWQRIGGLSALVMGGLLIYMFALVITGAVSLREMRALNRRDA